MSHHHQTTKIRTTTTVLTFLPPSPETQESRKKGKKKIKTSLFTLVFVFGEQDNELKGGKTKKEKEKERREKKNGGTKQKSPASNPYTSAATDIISISIRYKWNMFVLENSGCQRKRHGR